MSNVYDYMWLIPVLPALGAVIIALFGPRFLKNQSHWPCVLAAGTSALLSFGVFAAVNSDDLPKDKDGKSLHSHSYGTWFRVSPVSEAEQPKEKPLRDVQVEVEFSLRADALSAIMLVTVTFISTLIAIFAIGYMHGDP